MSWNRSTIFMALSLIAASTTASADVIRNSFETITKSFPIPTESGQAGLSAITMSARQVHKMPKWSDLVETPIISADLTRVSERVAVCSIEKTMPTFSTGTPAFSATQRILKSPIYIDTQVVFNDIPDETLRVPEPGSLFLIGGGGLILLIGRRRLRKNSQA